MPVVSPVDAGHCGFVGFKGQPADRQLTDKIDAQASRCDDELMRTTIDLPDDLHRAVMSIAAHGRRSMNQTVAELIRRGLALPAEAQVAPAATALRFDERTGLPLIRSPRPVTVEDVRALDDE